MAMYAFKFDEVITTNHLLTLLLRSAFQLCHLLRAIKMAGLSAFKTTRTSKTIDNSPSVHTKKSVQVTAIYLEPALLNLPP
jgi:hypothetical protein